MNGSTKTTTAYGDAAVDGLLKKEGEASAPGGEGAEDVQLALRSFRLLIADLCQQFGMGELVSLSALTWFPSGWISLTGDGGQDIRAARSGWLRLGSRCGSMRCGTRRIRRGGLTGIGLCCRMVRFPPVRFAVLKTREEGEKGRDGMEAKAVVQDIAASFNMSTFTSLDTRL